MTVTFLQAVNASLKRVRVIQGDAGELATSTVTSTATGLVATGAFVDSGRQTQIDLMLQLWQEASHELYGMGLFAAEAATATLTMVEGATGREYDMPSDFERFSGEDAGQRVFRAATEVWNLSEYPGGYAQMLVDQNIATDWVGQPNHYAISPVTRGRVRVDRDPDSGQDGKTFNILYDKRISLTSTMATDTLPYSDTVADALVPVVSEAWNRIMKKEFDEGAFQSGLVRAVSHVTQTQPRARGGFRRSR